MKRFTVTGMSCAACQARVEKAVSNLPGVESCAVSLLTNSMSVEGSATSEQIIKAVEKAGYGAVPKDPGSGSSGAPKNEIPVSDTPVLRKRLIVSAVFLLLLMYICFRGPFRPFLSITTSDWLCCSLFWRRR